VLAASQIAYRDGHALVALLLPALLVPLALRRLQEIELPRWLALLLLVPLVNVVAATTFALAGGPIAHAPRRIAFIPHWQLASAAVAVALTSVLAVGTVWLGANVLEQYGLALFVAMPYCLGLFAALVYGANERRGIAGAVGVSALAVVIAGVALVGVALEGAICVVMALPLALPLGILGGITGAALLWRPTRRPPSELLCSVVLLLPALLGLEATGSHSPRVLSVETEIVVDAPPDVVWRHVVAVRRLPPPREAVFKAGIAYPIEATIEGTGVGAVRRCRFSTGDFVEPITAWEPGRRLAFSVRSQPEPMRELSPFGAHPPHLDGFLRSLRGEFLLEPLPGGRTRLRGTSWYVNRMWPQRYWQVWSDELMHRIHRRVLEHVKLDAERAASST
jgi:hypothetical protein